MHVSEILSTGNGGVVSEANQLQQIFELKFNNLDKWKGAI
jgi:hypothetical protein